jgi:hypothetical protein
MNWAEAFAVLVTYLFNLAMWAGTACVIHFWGWSYWFLLVPVAFFVTIKTGKAAEDD